jgi:hypothetical protein
MSEKQSTEPQTWASYLRRTDRPNIPEARKGRLTLPSVIVWSPSSSLLDDISMSSCISLRRLSPSLALVGLPVEETRKRACKSSRAIANPPFNGEIGAGVKFIERDVVGVENIDGLDVIEPVRGVLGTIFDEEGGGVVRESNPTALMIYQRGFHANLINLPQ